MCNTLLKLFLFIYQEDEHLNLTGFSQHLQTLAYVVLFYNIKLQRDLNTLKSNI